MVFKLMISQLLFIIFLFINNYLYIAYLDFFYPINGNCLISVVWNSASVFTGNTLKNLGWSFVKQETKLSVP